MADIDLTLNGDPSGAVGALNATAAATSDLGATTKSLEGDWNKLEAAGKKQEQQLNNVKAGFLAVGAAAVKFGVDSVKAYAEAERISRQLERAAGDLAGAFEQQADALESTLKVDAELIKQQQTLLLQWGAAPNAIEPAIRAIQDYAAASGKDAVTATKEFIQAVEKGDAKLAKFGVTYEQTGDKTKDLTELTKKMTEALGGAAAANANSLEGGLNAVDTAFGNVKEAFGGVIASMEGKIGVLDKVATAMQRIARGISGSKGVLETLSNLDPIGMMQNALGFGSAPDAPSLPDITQGASTPVGSAPFSIYDPKKAAAAAAPKGATTKPGRTDDDRLADAKKFYDDLDQLADTALKQDEDRYAEELALSAKRVADDIKAGNDSTAALQLSISKDLAAEEKRAKEMAKAEERALQDSLDRTKKKEREAAAAGDAIGAAMVNALADQLSKLAEGGEFDAALFVGDIMAAAVGVAGGIIGTALGAPAVGAAIGNLAAMGVRAGASAISRSGKRNRAKANTYHDGGWVDAPRFHDGTWIAPDEQKAILQRDERVLSRREVKNAGGREAVDRMAKGGGAAVNVYLQAIDSQSAADSFRTRLGDGLRQALRSGQGAMPALLGVGPR